MGFLVLALPGPPTIKLLFQIARICVIPAAGRMLITEQGLVKQRYVPRDLVGSSAMAHLLDAFGAWRTKASGTFCHLSFVPHLHTEIPSPARCIACSGDCTCQAEDEVW